MIQIHFEPAEQEYLNAIVSEGYCRNIEEAIKRAVRSARVEDEIRQQRLQAALAEGLADVKAGRVDTYTPELMKKIAANARKDAAAGKIPDADVTP